MMAAEGKLYAGFDLGGTKMSMSLIDEGGEVVRRERLKKPANISSAGGMAVACDAISLIAGSGYLPDIAAMTFAVAGYSNKGELYDFEQTLRRELGSGAALRIMPDYEIFFHSDWRDFSVREKAPAGSGGEGALRALIICGTGSIVLACGDAPGAEKMNIARIFGGGAMLSDPGSGFDLGLRFLRRYGVEFELGAVDDRVRSLAEAFGCPEPAEIARQVRPASQSCVAGVASFAPLMLAIAESSPEGGPYLRDTLEAANNLALGARRIFNYNFKNYIDKPLQILFNGSVLLKSEFYRDLMKRNLLNTSGAAAVEFFEAGEDVSLICARYSKSFREGG